MDGLCPLILFLLFPLRLREVGVWEGEEGSCRVASFFLLFRA